MDRRAAVVAARVGGVMAVESLIRARTAPALWGAAILGVAAVAAGVVVGDVAGVLLVLLGVLVLAGWGVGLAVRAGALFTLRRAGAGADYDRVRPVIARHLDAVRQARSAVSLGRAGLRGVLRMARRPAEVEAMVREAGAAVCRRVPALVDEVEAALRDR